jgi:hypothetical protein
MGMDIWRSHDFARFLFFAGALDLASLWFVRVKSILRFLLPNFHFSFQCFSQDLDVDSFATTPIHATPITNLQRHSKLIIPAPIGRIICPRNTRRRCLLPIVSMELSERTWTPLSICKSHSPCSSLRRWTCTCIPGSQMPSSITPSSRSRDEVDANVPSIPVLEFCIA